MRLHRVSFFLPVILLACVYGHAGSIRWGDPIDDKSIKPHYENLSRTFARALPNYRHTFFEANIQRILREMEKTSNTCSLVVFKTPERTKIAYFTPVGLMPPPLVVTRASLAKAWVGPASSISLKTLLKKSRVHGESGVRRSFGRQIDSVVQAVKENNLNRNYYEFFPKNVFDMISSGRVDYTVEHPFVIERYLRDPRYIDLVFLEIEEATEPLDVHLSCSRSPEGLLIVEQVDRWIREKIRTPELKDRLTRLYEGGSTVLKLAPADLDRFIKMRVKKVMIE